MNREELISAINNDNEHTFNGCINKRYVLSLIKSAELTNNDSISKNDIFDIVSECFGEPPYPENLNLFLSKISGFKITEQECTVIQYP